MTSSPPIAVQIVTWNHAAVIDACLASLSAQTLRDFEVVVVDNASTDDTRARVEGHRSALPRLDVVAELENTGFCRGQNTATCRTTAPIVLFLNPDTTLPEAFLATAVECFAEAPPTVGALAPCLVRPDGTLDSTGLDLDRFRRAYDRDRGQPAERRALAPSDVFGCTGAAALLRRTMLDQLDTGAGPLDEALFAYCDDMDLAWRARLSGWGCRYESRLALVHHRMARNAIRGVANRPPRARDQFLMVRNRLLVMAKCERGLDFVQALAWLVPFELTRLVFLAVRLPHCLAAYTDAIRLMPGALRARRELHRAGRHGKLGPRPWRVK